MKAASMAKKAGVCARMRDSRSQGSGGKMAPA